MAITIILPDGSKFNERTEPMTMITNEAKQATDAALVNVDARVRSIAAVAAELEAALLASTRVNALREELEGLLGKRRRAKKGA